MRLKLQRPLVLFDLESTGTSTSDDSIVEISIIKISPDGTEEKYNRRIKPPIPIPESASKIHGITDKDVENELPFPSIAKSLLALIEGCDIGGFINMHFDVPMLYREFYRCGLVWDIKSINIIDAGIIFKRMEERTLAAAVEFYLNKKIENAHVAANDIQYTKDVLIAQMEKYNDLPCDNIEELALFCNYDKHRLDIEGKFKMDEYGNVIINFSKHRGKKASEELGFIEWMIHPDRSFLPDTIAICQEILRTHSKPYNDLNHEKEKIMNKTLFS